MLENLKAPSLIGKQDISLELLYNFIICQETRLFKLEKDFESVQAENSSLKLQLGNFVPNTELARLNLDLAKVSEGVGKLETFQEECEGRLGALELVPKDPPQGLLKEGDAETLVTAKREIPLLHDGLRELEGKFDALGTRVEDKLKAMSTEVEGLEGVVHMVETGDETTGDATAQVTPPTVATVPRGLANAEAKINKLTEDIKTHVKSLQDMQRDLRKSVRRSHLEAESTLQYSMRDSVKIFGVPFHPNENTNDIVRRIGVSIGVQIRDSDISVSHRTGRVNGSNPRPIIVKFARRDVKYMVMRNKKFARNIKTDAYGTTVRLFIDEHLTPMRAKVCKHLREGKVPHYTRDGKVFILYEEGGEIKKVINTPDDWEQVDVPDSLKVELSIYPRD